MHIRPAESSDLEAVRKITCETIQIIYPRYYPKGAIDFFLSHYSDENIAEDIILKRVFLLEIEKLPVGTVTIKNIEICRLFVHPSYQRKGYGRALLDFAEQFILKKSKRIQLAASLPAKEIYLNRGYREISSHLILTENGDFLFYEIMEKKDKGL